ncbi:uncharacterized protein N7529_001898 [Penicillium soppii]|uniref:uncharacterized protein n=1 Tax=Penicillium soppii TaxID=69789 RepID=UPI002548DC63|nr:uncharacterized protein N7529_001898 [Penicillium soppii]KAJ5876314.1 hypothetical protein N7529_001898 [Penicillium soppii]
MEGKMASKLAFLLATRECDGDASMSSCEKPTSKVLTIGIPAAITGVIVAVAIIVCGTIYYRRHKRDQLADLEDVSPAQRLYAYDNSTRINRRPGHAPTNDGPGGYNGPLNMPNHTSRSRYNSESPFSDLYESRNEHALSTFEYSGGTPHQREDGTRILVGGKIARGYP